MTGWSHEVLVEGLRVELEVNDRVNLDVAVKLEVWVKVLVEVYDLAMTRAMASARQRFVMPGGPGSRRAEVRHEIAIAMRERRVGRSICAVWRVGAVLVTRDVDNINGS